MRDRPRRDTVRAVALAAILVVSVLVGPLGASATAAAESTVIVVDDDGSGDYETIQAAVNNATPGDTIQVEPGRYEGGRTYDAQVRVDTPDLTIRGDPGDSSIGPGPDAPYLNGTLGPGFELTEAADGTTITGFTGNDVSVDLSIGGINSPGLRLENVTVSESRFSSVGGKIETEGKKSAYSDVEITGNVLESVGLSTNTWSGSEYTLAGITVANNRIEKAVTITSNSPTTVRNLSVRENDAGRVYVSFDGGEKNVTGVRIARNDVTADGGGSTGLTLELHSDSGSRYRNVSVRNNTLELGGIVDTGIRFTIRDANRSTYDVAFVDNVVNESQSNGMVVQTRRNASETGPTITARIAGNEFRNNGESGLRFTGYKTDGIAAAFEVRRNVFAGNAYGVTNNVTSEVVDARKNYWGSSDGPASRAPTALEDPVTGALADGSGQTVSEDPDTAGVANVRFDPFLSRPPGSDERANFSVRVDGSNTPVVEGETLSVVATVENTGGVGGTQTVTLSVGGVQRDAATVTVGSGDSKSVTLSWRTGTTDAGDYTAVVGTADDAASTSVTVRSGDPTAAFTYSPPGPATGETVSFNASGSADPNGRVATYEWDFDDDGTFETSGATATHAFASTGSHAVTLRVTDDSGATDTVERTVDVADSSGSPTANFTFTPPNPTVGENVVFDAGNSTDPDGRLVSYEWNLDADATAEFTGEVAHVSFSSARAIPVTLRVTDDDGNTATVQRTVEVTSATGTPTANVTVSPSNPSVGERVTLDAAQSTDPDGRIATYRWDFDGDGTLDRNTTSAVVTHRFASAGTYPTTLLVVDDDGNADSARKTIIVGSGGREPPTATFTASPQPADADAPVTLNASNSTDPDGRIVSYEWDVEGDRSFDATTTSATHRVTYRTPGDYNVTLRVTDDDGNTATTTRLVTVADRTPPTVSVTGIGAGTATTPPTGQTIHTNGTVSIEIAANGTPGDAAAVGAAVSATFANFQHRVPVTRQRGDTWTATGDLTGLADDGTYTVRVAAIDAAGNRNATTANVTLHLDRAAPSLAATVSRIDSENGSVNVTASEPLTGPPTIRVEKPDGTVETATIVEAGDGYWNATFDLVHAGGQYDVTVTGTDRAGNQGTGTASTVVDTVATTNNTATVVVEPSGLFVTFTTDASVSDTVVVTESNTPLAPVPTGDEGVNFLNAQLGDRIAGNLSHALVGIPVNASAIPASVDRGDVEIRFYNETTAAWERRATTVEQHTIQGTTRAYWVTNVSHFSTYGAVASDTAAPTLDSRSPTDGSTTRPDPENVTVEFTYSDALSGVNASSVTLAVDGTAVTTAPTAQITSQRARYVQQNPAPGQHTATVTVTDAAGNTNTYSTTYTVATDTTPPAVALEHPSADATLPAGTSTVRFVASYRDAASGIDPGSVQVTFDGTDVTSAATVNATHVAYTASGLANDTTHTFAVTVADSSASPTTATERFSVSIAAADTGDAGDTGDTGDTNTNTGRPGVDAGDTGDGDTGTGDARVTTSARSFGTAVTIENPPQTAVSVDVATAGAGVTVNELAVDAGTQSAALTVNVYTPTERPTDAPALEAATPVSYFRVAREDATAQPLDGVDVTFSVDRDALPADATPAQVALYHYADGQWTALDTQHLNGTDYRAHTDGLSEFAVGVTSTDGQQTGEGTTTTSTTTTTTSTTTTTTSTTTASDTTSTTTAATASTQANSTTETSVPGFGIGMGLLAMLAVAALKRRR